MASLPFDPAGPFELRAPPHAQPLSVSGGRLIRPANFPVCPICLTPGPTHPDHLPPKAIGGRASTLTCKPCNTVLGSKVEKDLADWFFERVQQVRFSHPDLRGQRVIPKTELRWGEGGEAILLVDHTPDEVADMIGPDANFTVSFMAPSPGRYKTALLKSAYLAACLHLRCIPDTPGARAVRAELLAARDAPRRDFVAGPLAEGLRVGRAYTKTGQGLYLVRLEEDDGTDSGAMVLETVLVGWPIPDLPSDLHPIGLQVGNHHAFLTNEA